MVSKCKYDGCNKNPSFNFKGIFQGLFCSSHKLERMVNIKDKYCLKDDCSKRASFNFKGEPKAVF